MKGEGTRKPKPAYTPSATNRKITGATNPSSMGARKSAPDAPYKRPYGCNPCKPGKGGY